MQDSSTEIDQRPNISGGTRRRRRTANNLDIQKKELSNSAEMLNGIPIYNLHHTNTGIQKIPDIPTERHKRKHTIDNLDPQKKALSNSAGELNCIAKDLCGELRKSIVQDINEQLKLSINKAVRHILEESKPVESIQSTDWLRTTVSDRRIPSQSEKWLPEKEFCQRNSILSDLLKISHIKTVYNIFVAILIIFSTNTLLSDFVEKGGIVHTYHIELFIWFFTGIYDVVNCWLVMFLSTSFVVYLTFVVWSTHRKPLPVIETIDWLFLALYVVYQTGFLILPIVFIYTHDLAPASTMIIATEQTRMMMKSHAFIRVNVHKALRSPEETRKCSEFEVRENSSDPFLSSLSDDITASIKDDSSMSNGRHLPPFSTYLYFLFAPTLIFRESYPRTPCVRWSIVAVNFLQVGICIVFNYYIFARFCFSHFINFGKLEHFHFSIKQLVISSFGCMLPGALVFLITFYAFLHCWLNAFAEMLRFGDRLFYKDWWNSFNFEAYYRGWNVVVHDWLYTYVYRDIYAVCKGRRRRLAAQTAVFLLSAVMHEYILSVVFRFFYPVLFVIFGGVGFAITMIKGKSRVWNIGIWVSLFLGLGILMCLYSMEWYARTNCPPTPGGYLIDFFAPRSWFCGR